MTTVLEIQAIFSAADAAQKEAALTKKAMAAVLLQAFQRLMPPGTLLDLRFSRENPPPAYLTRVRTLQGNDRGTKVFRIVNVVAVDAEPGYPDLSTWIADAVPISEKTGKAMLASTGRSSGRETVRLHGNVGCEYGAEEAPTASASRVLDLLAKLLATDPD